MDNQFEDLTPEEKFLCLLTIRQGIILLRRLLDSVSEDTNE